MRAEGRRKNKMMKGKLSNLDSRLSKQLALTRESREWHRAAKVAHLGDGTYVFGGLGLLFVMGWLFKWPSLQYDVLVTLLSLAITALAIIAIKYTLRRERPGDPTGFVTIQYDKYSFPSGHSARMSSLAGTILLLMLPLGIVLTILAFMVAIARVLISVHYVGDVTVGLLIGFVIGVSVGFIT